MTTPYMAFPASDHLYQLTEGFITRMRDGARQPEPVVLENIMTAFIGEALNAFFLKPAMLAGLGPTQKQLVRMATDTITGTLGLVIRRSAKKMDLSQNQRAAEYMDEIRLPASDRSFWYVAFPLDEKVANRGQTLDQLIDDESASTARAEMVSYLHDITDQALLWYFSKPLELLDFGPILRKLAVLGKDTTRHASYGVINRVIPRLNNEQLLQSAIYYKSMQIYR